MATPMGPCEEVTSMENAVLITGIAGRFPNSSSVKDFQEHLYNKEDMMSDTSERWSVNHVEIPSRHGLYPAMDKFDAQFFGVHASLANTMDPTARMLLETAYEAIMDAGINPRTLRNTNTGVFVANSKVESSNEVEVMKVIGYGMMGSSRTMMANRISYWLGCRGPSYSIDTACCSSGTALEMALQSLRRGDCDAAVVGGTNLCRHPSISVLLRRMGIVSPDGITKCFDETGDGYGRSDAIVTIFLQNAKYAKRVYAELVHVKSSFLNFNEYYYPERERLEGFLGEFYEEVNVDPSHVEYVEACGSGLKTCDRDELQALDQVYCIGERKKPLLVGCVKSNMGNANSASDLVAIVKVCLGFQTGRMAANLHLNSPITDVKVINEGRIVLLTDHAPFEGGYAAINNSSYTGVSTHFLLKKYEGKQASIQTGIHHYNLLDFPYLVCFSGRIDNSMTEMFSELEGKPLDRDQIALIHNIYEHEMPGLVLRGYDILAMEEGKTVSLQKEFEYFDGSRRPVWFVYSGMGSQWPAMGAQLLRIPVFAGAIDRCRLALLPFGLDLMQILTNPDTTIFDNILHSFVGIAAIQIGLTDVLKEIGIEPDNIIGHSVGELGCAYADGCLTAEETILSAYGRGLVSVRTPFIRGAMRRLRIKHTCPPAIEVACHNGPDSCTISGPIDDVTSFVAELTSLGIFAKEVACSNIAYHSRYISEAGPSLRKFMLEVIKSPKARSSKWISSSVPKADWDEPAAKLCSADYLTNNLLNPVLFEEASQMIPENAITIEIAPHGLLQAILKRSLPASCMNVALTRRAHPNNAEHLLSAIAKLYMAGLYPKIKNLYPAVAFPVPAGTPLLSHTAKWDTSESWYVSPVQAKTKLHTGEHHVLITTCDQENEYLSGHIVNDKMRLPAAAILVMVWETLGMILGVPYTKLGVNFKDVKFEVEVTVPEDELLELVVMVHKISGNFEVSLNKTTVAKGQISPMKITPPRQIEEPETGCFTLTDSDIYRMLGHRGYTFSGPFRSLITVDSTFSKAQVNWNGNWVTFLDSLMQLAILNSSSGTIRPYLIETLSISVPRKNSRGEDEFDANTIEATHYKIYNTIRGGAVEIKGLVTKECTKDLLNDVNVEKQVLVPYNLTSEIKIDKALRIIIELIIENSVKELQITEILKGNQESTVKDKLLNIINDISYSNIKNTILREKEIRIRKDKSYNNVFITQNLLENKMIQTQLLDQLSKDDFIISQEPIFYDLPNESLSLVSSLTTEHGKLVLLKKKSRKFDIVIKVPNDEFSWLAEVREQIFLGRKVCLVSNKTNKEIIDVVRSLRIEANNNSINLLMLDDVNEDFDHKLPIYNDQINKGMTYSVYENNSWGSYRLQPATIQTVQNEEIELTIETPGLLNTLIWKEAFTLKCDPRNIFVNVHYARLSYIDLARAQGQILPGLDLTDRKFGVSYSGVTVSGQRVMGLVPNGALSTLIKADTELLWPVPDHWTLEDAATVPQAYLQAFYCLKQRSKLIPGSNVMINSGAGALGQALISICLAEGCTVFTTIKNIRRKRMLLKLFPELKDQNVFLENDNTLNQAIMVATGGKGCQIVVNSTHGTDKEVMTSCVSDFNSFLDVCLQDMRANNSYIMGQIRHTGNYVAVNFASIFNEKMANVRKALSNYLIEGIVNGYVFPTTRLVLEAQDAPRAFRLLAPRRNYGSIVLRMRPRSKQAIPSVPIWKGLGNASYIVICDKNCLGLEVVDQLIKSGAKILVIHTDEPESIYLKYKVSAWTKVGVTIHVCSENLKTENGCNFLLESASAIASLSALFIVKNLTDQKKLTLKTLNDHKEDRIVISNLDKITRKLYPDLRYFVVVACTPDENSKGFAAKHLGEEVCINRAKDGLPALMMRCEIPKIDQTDQNSFDTISTTLLEVFSSAVNMLTTDNTIITASIKKKSDKDVVTSLIKSLEALNEQRTLKSLNVDYDNLRTLSKELNQKFGLFYTHDKLGNTTLKQLKDINVAINACAKPNLCEMLYTHYDDEDYAVSEPLVWVPTLVSDVEEGLQSNEGDDYLILVPGFDGTKHGLLRLCRRLKVRALVCQLSTLSKRQTIPEMALHFIQALKQQCSTSRYHILGYSFGALVALEMAALFEKEGITGKVFCLDGSPLSLQTMIRSELAEKTESGLQNELLLQICRIITDEDTAALETRLRSAATWDEKLITSLKHLHNKVHTSMQYQREILEAAWTKITQVLSYEPDCFVLKADVLLLRAKSNLELPRDYGLGKFTNRPVSVSDIDASHVTVPYNLKTTNIVNTALDDDILDRFQKLNLCISTCIYS